ncbi:MAG: segregation/condensation protein A [Tenericutes bacterium]|nr:segregation/condensation protein A [Mycoplasmatota bacterium]
MNYTIEINNFEGPLDLLLHLIKKAELDICEISIVEITKQYLDYINLMESMNLNIASEYLTMAAELIEIKSSILLPKKKIDNEDDYEEDPKENLINRLIEYEKYKEISEVLKKYEQDRKELYTKKPTDLEIYNTVTNEISENFDLNDLMSALNKMLDRKKLDKPLNTKITNREYSITERSNQIKNILKNKKQVEFTDLFDIYSKDYIVITFLSILTMARHQELSITQDRNFGKIMIERVD